MFKFKNEEGRETLYIYGAIGEDFWSPEDSNRAKDIAQYLDSISPAPLDIRIDSGGGDVYEGFAIASAIQRYKGAVTVYIDGMAASAASYIALMGDEVVMNDFACVMIHNAWTMAVGNKEELARTIDQLSAIDETIAGIIEKRSALTHDEVVSAMQAETWYFAEDALLAGICNTVIETETRMAASIDKCLAERYSNVPQNVQLKDEAKEPVEAPTEPEVEPIAPEPEAIPAVEDEVVANDDEVPSHPVDILDAEKPAILLGNRVYR